MRAEGPLREIVVGVDGSTGSLAALRWSVGEARHHGAPVAALLAWSLLDQHHAPGTGEFEPAYGDADAAAALHRYVELALGEGAATSGVVERVVCDLPVHALTAAAADDVLVLVGRRGHGGFPGLRLGSVGDALLGQAAGPVGVVADDAVTEGAVLVGVDGSEDARRALRWAVREARARGADLVVVHAWEKPWLADWVFEDHAPLFEALRADAARCVEQELALVDVGDVVVRTATPEGTAGRCLVEAAAGASLVVVGCRGLGAVKGAVFGSVSRQVVHHAPGAVVVAPPDA